MAIPPFPIEVQVVSAARQNRSALLDDLARAASPGEPTAVVCDRATAAVDRYSATLLADLILAAQPLCASDATWVRDRYLDLMLELATSACDLVKDSGARHAVAQAVQCTILQHEQQLRSVLESALASDH